MSTKPFPALEQAARECHYEAARDINSECFEWAFERCIAKECKEARAELRAARELLDKADIYCNEDYGSSRTPLLDLIAAIAGCQPKGGDAK